MFVPGFVISVITFPGVIVHELAHQLFCRWMGVAVFEVCYFQFGNPAGFVIHETPRSPYQHILIGIGPFFVNSVLGVLIGLPGAIGGMVFTSPEPLDIVLLWLGISIAMHAFPSTGDAAAIWAAVWKQPTSALVRLVATPVVILIYLGALGSIVWLDVIYGIGLTLGVTSLIVSVLA